MEETGHLVPVLQSNLIRKKRDQKNVGGPTEGLTLWMGSGQGGRTWEASRRTLEDFSRKMGKGRHSRHRTSPGKLRGAAENTTSPQGAPAGSFWATHLPMTATWKPRAPWWPNQAGTIHRALYQILTTVLRFHFQGRKRKTREVQSLAQAHPAPPPEAEVCGTHPAAPHPSRRHQEGFRCEGVGGKSPRQTLV